MNKYIYTAVMAAASVFFAACSADEPENISVTEVEKATVNFNVSLNDYEQSRSGEAWKWSKKDVIVIYSSNNNRVLAFLLYDIDNDKWEAETTDNSTEGVTTIFLNKDVLSDCRLYYVSNLDRRYYDSVGKDFKAITTDVQFTHYQSDNAKYLYSDGVLDVTGTLKPRTGRIAIRSAVKSVWRCSDWETIYTTSSFKSNPLRTDFSGPKQMSLHDDGKYYTAYLHLDHVPRFINERNNIYEYADPDRKIAPGQSVVIDAPSEITDTDTWKSWLAKGGYDRYINLAKDTSEELVNGDYSNNNGFSFFGSYMWKPEPDKKNPFDSNNTPFHFVVETATGETIDYPLPAENNVEQRIYNFNIDIEEKTIKKIYMEVDEITTNVRIFDFKLLFKP